MPRGQESACVTDGQRGVQAPLKEGAEASEELKIRGFDVTKDHGCLVDVVAGTHTLQDRLLEQDSFVTLSESKETVKPWVKTVL